MEDNSLNKLGAEDVEGISGGGDGNNWARVKCPKCDKEFTFRYDPVITCPYCWVQIPLWQGDYGVKRVDGPEE